MEAIACTSYDHNFNIQDIFNEYFSFFYHINTSDLRKFWTTTGMYPQEILVDLKGKRKVQSVRMVSHSIKKVRIEGCDKFTPTEFKPIGEKEFINTTDKLQDMAIPVFSVFKK